MSDGFDQLNDNDIDGPTLQSDFVVLRALRERDLSAKAEYEEAHRAYLAKRAAVYERMADEGIESQRLTGVGLFIRNEPTWRPAMQDKGAFFAWARESMPDLLETQYAKGLLNQLVQERMRDGQDLPPGLGAYPEKIVSIRKA